MSRFVWASVTAVSPALRIKLDGDTVALPITPDSLVDVSQLAVSDRVRVHRSDRRVVVVGRSGGMLAGVLATIASHAASIADLVLGLTRAPRAIIPSSVVVGSGSASVGTDGLVSFSGASSVSLVNVFDGLLGDTYRIIVEVTGITGTVSAFMRLRTAAGADATTVYNYAEILKNDWSTAGAYGGATGASGFMFVMPSSMAAANFAEARCEYTIFRPNKATMTTEQGVATQRGSAQYIWWESGDNTNSTAYPSISLLFGGGTGTGTIKVVKIA